MKRKRLTQILPFLLPIRRWQRKFCFYLRMRLDSNKYAKDKAKDPLPFLVYETELPIINPNSGYDIKYQHNKAHNLRVASRGMHELLIHPGEVFSFWQAARKADKNTPYKDALSLSDGKIIGAYGGGLCQLSNMLFWVFVNSPLTVTERHPHAVESFPSPPGDIPEGADATVSEGWLDLKVKNETSSDYQLLIQFDSDHNICVKILSSTQPDCKYLITSENVHYKKVGEYLYRYNEIYKETIDIKTHATLSRVLLFSNKCMINYAIEGVNEDTIAQKEEEDI